MWRKGSPLIFVIGLLAVSQVFCCSTAGGNSCINPNDRISKTPTIPGNSQPIILTPTPAVPPAAAATPTPDRTQGDEFLPEQPIPFRPKNIRRLSREWRLDVRKAYDTDITLLATANIDGGEISFTTIIQ